MGAFAGAAQVISDRMHQQHLMDYQQNYLQNQALAAEFGRMAEDPRTLPQFKGAFRQAQIDAIMEQPGKLHKPKVPLADMLKQQEQERIRMNQANPQAMPGGMINHGALQGIPPPPFDMPGEAGNGMASPPTQQPSQGQAAVPSSAQGPASGFLPGQIGNGTIGEFGQPLPSDQQAWNAAHPSPADIAGQAIQQQNQVATQPGIGGTQVSGMPGQGFGNSASAGAGITPPPDVAANFGMRPPHQVAEEAVGPEPPMTDPGSWEESPRHALWRTLYSKAAEDEMQRQSEMRSKIGTFAYERAENKKFIDEYTGKGGHIKWKMSANGGISGEPDMGTRTPGYVLGSHILSVNPDAQAVSGGKKAPLEPFQLYHERTFENGESEYHPADIRARFQYEIDPMTHQPITVAYDPVSGRELQRLAGHPAIPGLLPVTSTNQEIKEVTGTDGFPHLVVMPVTRTTTKGGISAPPGVSPSPSSAPASQPAPTGGGGSSPALTAPPGTQPPVQFPGAPRGSRDLGISPSQNKITRNAALKAYTPALESAERFNIMTKNYLDAVKNNDQQAMVSLLTNHLGMTAGMVKGGRVSQALYNEAEKSRPWLQGAASKFDSEGYLSGVTLSQPQMHQMLSLGRERLVENLAKAKSEAGFMGASGAPPITPNRSTMHFYMALAKGDAGKAKSMASEDGWSVK